MKIISGKRMCQVLEQHGWTLARSVTVHRRGQAPQLLEADEELAVEDLLPGFRCKVAEFFWLPGETSPPQ